jgi:hypothetical protein
VIENSPTMANNKLATQAAETLDAHPDGVSEATVALSEAATTGINMQIFLRKGFFNVAANQF